MYLKDIHDVLYDRHSQSVVKAVIEVAHTLDLSVVAEGVETDEHVRILKLKECDKIKGETIS